MIIELLFFIHVIKLMEIKKNIIKNLRYIMKMKKDNTKENVNNNN